MVESEVTVRPARPEDAAAIAEIYNQGIRGRNATFETEERTPEDRRAWLAAHANYHPCLVATIHKNGEEVVAGWVSADHYRSRHCYWGVAEFSVYVHNDFQGRRIGKTLIDAFIPACEEAGLWKILSRIFPENEGSRALCRATGFREVGTYVKHAQLDGVWRDVIIVERLIESNQRPESQ